MMEESMLCLIIRESLTVAISTFSLTEVSEKVLNFLRASGVMDKQELPQIERLRLYDSVVLAMEELSPQAYKEAINWLKDHFYFPFSQQIDWSHDPHAVVGRIADLSEERLYHMLQTYNVEPSRRLTIVWAYADRSITLPLSLVAKRINDIWLPVLDDVFLF